MSGSVAAVVKSTFTNVLTLISGCSPTIAPADCKGAAAGANGLTPFSTTSIPVPVIVQPKQILQVWVTFSFESAPQ